MGDQGQLLGAIARRCPQWLVLRDQIDDTTTYRFVFRGAATCKELISALIDKDVRYVPKSSVHTSIIKVRK